ncbi:MAG: hypothetical protein KKG00_01725, partial [Bacteroidetes bacterium]|nr:hypothetical protein [Bacteroidota bacterium]
FEKLGTEPSVPYAFLRYGVDLTDQLCLYYRNCSPTQEPVPAQRIVLKELEVLILEAQKQKREVLDQQMFRKYCPRSSRHPSAYTVAVRLLEHLGLGVYLNRCLLLFSNTMSRS